MPSHFDLNCLHMCLYMSTGLKGVKAKSDYVFYFLITYYVYNGYVLFTGLITNRVSTFRIGKSDHVTILTLALNGRTFWYVCFMIIIILYLV